MSYKKLQIWAMAREVVFEVHTMTLKLPKFEILKKVLKSGDPVKQPKLLL